MGSPPSRTPALEHVGLRLGKDGSPKLLISSSPAPPPASNQESDPKLPSQRPGCETETAYSALSLSPIDFRVSKYCVTSTNCITSQ